MAEELYAQKLDISDDRVKETSIAEADFTKKAYAESAVLFPTDAGVKIADEKISIDDARRKSLISEDTYDKTTAVPCASCLQEFDKTEYEQREEESGYVKVDPGKTADIQAAAEIIEESAKLRKEELLRKEARIKYYAPNYREHIVRATKVRLISRDTSLDAEKEKELDRRTKAVKELNEAFITKYSNTKTFADRLLSISSDPSAKKLAAPAEQDKSFAYEGK